MYNPVSISRNLEMALNGYQFQESDLFRSGEFWHSFQHPGRFSDPDLRVVLQRLEKTSKAVQEWLQNTNRLFVTLGSSMVYVHQDYGGIVANCHKLPAAEFERKRLKVAEVVDSLSGVFSRMRSNRPDLQIVLTVSPVRHGKEGLHVNQMSKAVLLLAIDVLTEQYDYVHYFPAYELVLDDLRDYRFYKPDMMHPNEMAISYIWDFFCRSFFSDETQQLNKRIAKLVAAAQHQPRRPRSAAYRHFLDQQFSEIESLESTYPGLSFHKEREAFDLRYPSKASD